MKKRITILCLLLTAALLCPTLSGAAAPVADEAQSAQVYAVVNLADGDALIVDEAPGDALMRVADDYELFVEEEPVLSVDHLSSGVDDPAAQQFFSVDFTLPDTEVEVFLTGLSAENVASVQQGIIDSFVRGGNFDLTDLDFIDTEKTLTDTQDDDLCWAASASDMLAYTGWGAQAGFDDEDDIFEAFIDAYEDAGGNVIFALAWFFNGAALNDNSGSYAPRILDYPNSGGYLTDYAFDQVMNQTLLTAYSDMDRIAEELRAGSAISLGMNIYNNGALNGGHAVTMWGYTLDRAAGEDDPGRYLNVFITDSDSDQLRTPDRRSAPNIMNAYALEARDQYYWFRYSSTMEAQIEDYSTLVPYSEELPRETSSGATKRKSASPDLLINGIYLSDVSGEEEQETLFESGSDIYYNYAVTNYGDAEFSGKLVVQETITSSEGKKVYSNSLRYIYITGPAPLYSLSPDSYRKVSSLAPGDYTLTIRCENDHGAGTAEAYLYNNTATLDFKVRDSYLLGDFTDDGDVNVLDATAIQRHIARYSNPFGDAAPLRGDIAGDGLDVLDATLLQLWLAGYQVRYPVSEKLLYP